MKTYILKVNSVVNEEVEVLADNFDDAVDKYYEGVYDKSEIVNIHTNDITLEKIEE